MASLRNRSERLMGLRPLFMLIWLHIPPRSGWFSGLASPVLHVSPLVRIHTKSAIYSSTSDPFRGTLHRTTVLPSALPPRNRRNIRASGRFCIVSGAIKDQDNGANTVTGFAHIFIQNREELGVCSSGFGTYESIEKRSEVHLEATQVRSVFPLFRCLLFSSCFVLVKRPNQLSSGTTFLPLDMALDFSQILKQPTLLMHRLYPRLCPNDRQGFPIIAPLPRWP